MKTKPLPYQDARLTPARRAADLLARMTVEEKLTQLRAARLRPDLLRDPDTGQLDEKALAAACRRGWGYLSMPFRYVPPAASARVTKALQAAQRRHTRLGIPILIDGEALHGCIAPASTQFPQAIALAAAWNPRLLEDIGKAIGRECRARGIGAVLAPVLDVARDVRAGRTEETYGEDPFLVSRLGVAYIRGVQSQRVVTTPKHFAANFVGDGGRDSHPIHGSERLLREVYLPPYEAAFREAGALAVMTAYHALDGIPCSAHRWLLSALLRREWGFQGITVSDWGAVGMVHTHHRTADGPAAAAAQTFRAGLDIELPVTRYFNNLGDLVRSGEIPMARLDEAVRRVLTVKFWIGLFDRPPCSPRRAAAVNQCAAHRRLALTAARQSITLLKNEGLLPLAPKLRRIAVIGPNAGVGRLGGYSGSGVTVVSPLDGLRALPGKREIRFAEGCPLKDSSRRGFAAARAAARWADAVIMVMGNSAPDTEGENHDRCCLDLPGSQEDLILDIARINPRVAVVLVGGSAVTMQRWIDHVPAIVQAWYPGQEGGTALAEILTGRQAPGGKLPITFPKTTGQCPLYYNAKPSGRIYDYNDLRGEQVQFPFGHGLSYTTFRYDRLRLKAAGRGRKTTLSVSARITNTGFRAGDEVVQLYLRREYTRRSQPLQALKGFARITLKPGQSRTVHFVLGWRELAILDENLKPALEPGNLVIMLGSSARDIRLQAATRDMEFSDVAYEVSPLQPAIADIAQADIPPAATAFRPVPLLDSGQCRIGDLRPAHGGQAGLLYVRADVRLPHGGPGRLLYGADAPVKVWLEGKAVDCRPQAEPPVQPPDFELPVRWRKGRNRILFALDTRDGQAWGVTLRIRLQA